MSSCDEKEEEKAAPTATMNEDTEELADESFVSTIQIFNQEDNATTFHLFDKEHVVGLSSYFYSLYKSKTLTDISVECGTDKFQFHKPVLSYSSGYFSTLFETSPNVSSHKLTFEVEPAMFAILATFFYTGNVTPLTEENAIRLLRASYFLKASEAHDECTAFLEKTLHIDNCLDIWIEARICCNDVLLKQATAKVGRHLEQVCSTDTFLQLEFEQVRDLLSSDGLQVVSEMVVYNAAMGWIKHDLSTRESHLYDVLSLVRLNYLSREFLTETVAEEALVMSDKDAMSLYLNALQYKLGSPKAKAPTTSKNRRRRDSFRHSVVGGVERYAKQQQEMALQVVPESKPNWKHWLDVHVVFPWQYFQTNVWKRYIATPVITWAAFCKQDVLEKHIAGPLSQTRNTLLPPPPSEPSIPGIRQENVIEKYILRPIAESPCIPDSSDEEYEDDEQESSPIEHYSPSPSHDNLLQESVWTKISEVATPEKEQTFTAVSVE